MLSMPTPLIVLTQPSTTHFLTPVGEAKLPVLLIWILSTEVELMAGDKPWLQHGWTLQSQHILDSYERLVGHQLIERLGSEADQAESLFTAPFVVVSHGTEVDPLLNYANAAALQLWKISISTLLETPSRMTAEAMHRDERAELLERTTRDGYVDDYRGIRIATDGQRFLIDRATVWNLTDKSGHYAGQAATFDQWTTLDEV